MLGRVLVLPPRRVQLADHGVEEPGEKGAEVGLDGGVAKGEVGQGDHGVPAHLASLSLISSS